jgi:hypothetical protein
LFRLGPMRSCFDSFPTTFLGQLQQRQAFTKMHSLSVLCIRGWSPTQETKVPCFLHGAEASQKSISSFFEGKKKNPFSCPLGPLLGLQARCFMSRCWLLSLRCAPARQGSRLLWSQGRHRGVAVQCNPP